MMALGLSLALGGCAVNPSAVKADDRDQMLSQLGQGHVILDCTFLCSHEYIFRQRTIISLYANQNWEDLGVAIMQAGWRQDITYFLLGVSAEQQGFLPAADGYYRIAWALATGPDSSLRCATIENLCQGLEFPRDIRERLTIVDEQILVERQAPRGAWLIAPQCQQATSLDKGVYFASSRLVHAAMAQVVNDEMQACRRLHYRPEP